MLLENFDKIVGSVDGIVRIREAVLKLAFTGKLVAQNEDDGVASTLLVECKKLAGRKKARSSEASNSFENNLSDCGLPMTWAICQLDDIGKIFNGNSISAGDKSAIYSRVKEGYPYIATKDVGYGRDALLYENGIKIPYENGSFKVAKAGSPLICCEGGSAGKKIGMTEKEICFGNKLYAFEAFPDIDSRFVFYYYQSAIFWHQFQERMTGIIGGTSLNKFVTIKVPLPPTKEQKRIVTKVDELMALIDDLEQKQQHRNSVRQKFQTAALDALVKAEGEDELVEAWGRVCDSFSIIAANSCDTSALRGSILQLAIKGNLTEASEHGEAASSLLQHIRDTTSQSPTHKKFAKRIMPGPTVSEHPFEISSKWEWVRLGCLCQRLDYGLSVKSSNAVHGTPILSMGHVQDSKILEFNLKKVPADSKGLPELLLCEGDILFNRTNSWELVGKAGLFTGESEKTTFASYLIRIRLVEGVLPEYLNYVLAAPYFRATQIEPEITQQTNQANFNGTKLANCVVPVPPLEEQKRIVAKVDELMKLCDKLEEHLKTKEELGNRLAEAVVAAA